MNLEELRRLNIRDVGNWPLLPKVLILAGIFIVILVLGLLLDWKDQWETLEAAEQEEVKLKEQYAQKKAKAINFELYVQQLNEVEQSFGALVKQLPNRSEIDALLTDINQAGLGRGLQFELFRPGQVEIKDYYAVLPITLRVTGRFHDIGAFTADVANLSRIVTLHNLAIAPTKDAAGNLSMDAIARTYRYLDVVELAEVRKARDAEAKLKAPRK